MKNLKRIVILALATGFGLGLSPFASGTVGSLLGVLIVYLLSLTDWSLWIHVAIAVGLVLPAIPICGLAEGYFGKKDDGRIVADEYMTYPLCMLGLPFDLWIVVVGFVVCRMFDIFKPPPARQFDRMGGGFGIVMDDVAASLYALAVNHLIYQLVLRYFLNS